MPASATALLVALALRRTLLLRLRGLWGALRTLLLRPALTARRLPVTTLLEPPLLLAIASAAALAALLVASRVATLRVRSLIAPLLGVATWLARGRWRRNALYGSRRWRSGLSLEPAEQAIDDPGVRFARSSLHRGGLRHAHRRLRPSLGRFSLSRNEDTSTGTCACTAPVFSFIASSCTIRSTCSAVDSVPRMKPVPLQRGQLMCAVSSSEGCSRWRDSSTRPKREILP